MQGFPPLSVFIHLKYIQKYIKVPDRLFFNIAERPLILFMITICFIIWFLTVPPPHKGKKTHTKKTKQPFLLKNEKKTTIKQSMSKLKIFSPSFLSSGEKIRGRHALHFILITH